jgi:hypothetical protein
MRVCRRESSVICVASQKALLEALPYIELSGTPLAIICQEPISEPPSELLCSGKIPLLSLFSGNVVPRDADGRIALVDFSRGLLIIDPSLDTLDRYGAHGGEAFRPTVKKSIIADATFFSSFTSRLSRTDCGLLCSAEDIAEKGDFFDVLMDIVESSSPASVCVSLLTPLDQNEEHFCEQVEALLCAAVYGELALTLEGYRSEGQLQRAVKMMHRIYCRLEKEGREISSYLARGITLSTPIWLLEGRSLPPSDFICFDFDRLCSGLFGISCSADADEKNTVDTLCRFWEDYRRINQSGDSVKLCAKSEELFHSKIFWEWVDFMGIREIYLPQCSREQKILDNRKTMVYN